MKRRHLWKTAVLASGLMMTFFLFQMPASAQTIVDTWDAVKAPPAPELKSVILDSKATALLLLDFNKQTCNAERRPRCIASIPKVQELLEEARSKGFTIIYSLSAGATSTDIARELAPRKGEPVVTAGPDKFMGTDLEKILMDNQDRDRDRNSRPWCRPVYSQWGGLSGNAGHPARGRYVG